MVLVASLYELSRPSSPSGLLHGSDPVGYIGALEAIVGYKATTIEFQQLNCLIQ